MSNVKNGNMTKKPVAYYLSRVLSYAMHPFLLPLYAVLLLFETRLIPVYVADGMKHYLLGLVVLNTLLIPAVAVGLMRLFRLIPDLSLSRRRDRIPVLFIVALCDGICGWLLKDVEGVFLLRKFVFAAMGCAIFAFGVNLHWQVSLHMTAAGGMVGVLMILLFGGFDLLSIPFCLTVLLSGALASARLYLGKHSPAQTAVGFFGGMVVSVAVMLFL